jgi:uncharacterized membrane-anchored protein
MLKLTDTQRNIVVGLMTVVILGAVNTMIVGKERIVADGTVVLLRLAPRDPRSLMQGDYMALRYSLAGEVARAAKALEINDGHAVVALDDQQVARFIRIHDDDNLGADEHLLQFRKRGETVRLASDAFFFEEGKWETYQPARYGALRIDANGNAVLTGLRDDDFAPL